MEADKQFNINALPIKEKLQLVGDIWDSITLEAGQLPLTDSQRVALDRRLDQYEIDPKSGSGWTAVRKRIER